MTTAQERKKNDMANRQDKIGVVWDFNGTILDDVQIGLDAVNVLLEPCFL